MAGVNPYIEEAEYTPATEPYTITYLHDGEETVVQVDPDEIPYTRTGLPGSVLDIAEGHNLDIQHTCGGVCACSTCHVIIRQGLDSTNEQTEDELDQLEEAPGLTMSSRLACQCVPDGSQNLVVEIPSWNRNAVGETPHG